MKNINHLINKEHFEFYILDITEKIDLSNKINNVDYVYHLACPAAPNDYQADPLKTISVCVNGTKNVLDFFLQVRNENGILLFTSTSEVYGDPLEHPQNENYWGNVHTTGIHFHNRW